MRRQVFKISIGQILLIIIVMCAVIWGLSLVNKEDAPEETEVVENISIDNTCLAANYTKRVCGAENAKKRLAKHNEFSILKQYLFKV